MEKKEKNKPVQSGDKYIVRFPDGMRGQIAEAAAANNRSMNAEIVARLQESFAKKPGSLRDAVERRKLELLAVYLEWCMGTSTPVDRGFGKFAKEYKKALSLPIESFLNGEWSYGTVSGIEEIDPQYLSELYGIWAMERDSRYPEHFKTKLVTQSVDLVSTGTLIDELLSRFPPGMVEVKIGKIDSE